MNIKDLKGLGPKSSEMLSLIGINTVEEFMETDPFDVYRRLHCVNLANLNFLYAIIGAQENIHWQEVSRTRKTEILCRLDDLGLAPC